MACQLGINTEMKQTNGMSLSKIEMSPPPKVSKLRDRIMYIVRSQRHLINTCTHLIIFYEGFDWKQIICQRADLAPVGFAVVAPLHHVVGDVGAAVVLGRLPEQGETVAAELVGPQVPRRCRTVQNLAVATQRSAQRRGRAHLVADGIPKRHLCVAG